MISQDQVREIYAKKAAEEGEESDDDDDGIFKGLGAPSTNSAQAGGMRGSKSVAILLRRLTSSRQSAGIGVLHIPNMKASSYLPLLPGCYCP